MHPKINFRVGTSQRPDRPAKRLRTGTVLFILSGFSVTCYAQSHRFADMVLLSAKIYTEDARHSIAQSLAVIEGKIAFVGDAAAVKTLIGPNTQIVNAGGRLVLPGLVDAHIHPTLMINFGACSLAGKAMTLAQIVDAIGGCREGLHLAAGEWLYVTLWESGAGNDPDPQNRNLRTALDAASPRNPVFLEGTDGYHAGYNSRALALAKNKKGETVGLSKATLAGEFAAYAAFVGTDGHGEPSGDVNEEARTLLDTSEIKRAQHAKIMREPERIMALLNSRGITAVQDAWVRDTDFEVYDVLIARKTLTVWLNMAQYHRPQDYAKANGDIDYDRLFARADELRRKYAANPLTKADAVKVFADGATESNPNTVPPTLGNSPRLVPYLQPIFQRDAHGHLTVSGYADPASPQCIYARANPGEYVSDESVSRFIGHYGYHPKQCAISYGTPAQEPAVFAEYIKQAHLRGYTLHIHAISDAAVRMAIDAIELARAADGISSQPDTLAHVEFAAPDDVTRMGKDHLYLAYTYSWAYADPTGYDMSLVPFYDHVLGNSYAAFHKADSYFEQTYYPFKTSKTSGAILIAGSDAPVSTTDPQPFINMEYAMTRAMHGMPPTGPWQRLDLQDVLDAYTINGAHALGRSSEIGSLEPGKSADFCVLNADILDLAQKHETRQIGAARIESTWFQGRQVYDARRTGH